MLLAKGAVVQHEAITGACKTSWQQQHLSSAQNSMQGHGSQAGSTSALQHHVQHGDSKASMVIQAFTRQPEDHKVITSTQGQAG